MTQQPTFLTGVKDCIPTLLGYFSIGLACGIVGIATHLTTLEITLLAALVYAGAAQFIICALIAAGSPAGIIIFTTFIVNLRNFLLSMTLAPHFTHYSLMKNIGLGALVTDETFGVAISKIMKQEPLSDRWMNGLNLTAYVFWIISCYIGAVFGKWIKDPETFGLDFSLVGMFIALLVITLQHISQTKMRLHLLLIGCVIICMLCLSMVMPSYIAIIVTTVIAATIGVILDK